MGEKGMGEKGRKRGTGSAHADSRHRDNETLLLLLIWETEKKTQQLKCVSKKVKGESRETEGLAPLCPGSQCSVCIISWSSFFIFFTDLWTLKNESATSTWYQDEICAINTTIDI